MGIARHHGVLSRASDMLQTRLGAARSMVPCMHSAAQHAARKAGIIVQAQRSGPSWASEMHHARSGREFLPCPTPFDPFRSPVPAWISCIRATAFRTEAGRSRAPRAGRGRGSGASNTAAAADRRLVLEEGDSMPFRTARIDLEYRRSASSNLASRNGSLAGRGRRKVH